VAKGVADLARAIKQFSSGDGAAPAQWLFVGDGPLRAMLEELPTCRLAGPVDHLALRDYYDAADALFLPSHQEGLPTVTLEAGSRGLPVAATDVGSVRDVVSADTGWLLRPQNDDDLLQAMRAAASVGSEALGSRGDRLFQIVRTTYSAATNAATVRERYATLCKALG